jgi:hypothetical protein
VATTSSSRRLVTARATVAFTPSCPVRAEVRQEQVALLLLSSEMVAEPEMVDKLRSLLVMVVSVGETVATLRRYSALPLAVVAKVGISLSPQETVSVLPRVDRSHSPLVQVAVVQEQAMVDSFVSKAEIKLA